MTAATGDSLSFGYDTLKRLNRVTVKNGSSVILNTAYAYRDVSWNRGSAQVEFRNVRLGSDSGMLLEGKKYVYDDVGNLKEIRESTGDFNKLVEYTYDSQNQLTSEAYYKSGEAEAYITYNYTYDTAGNLLTVSQKKGNTTTLLQTYTYGDAQWHDLLTAVNGQAITYDASGNPLSYGGWSFGWQNGRQLKTASKTSDGKTETLEYAYDADGIRTSKTYTVETFTQVPDYTVTFQADGATVKTMTVEDGYTLKDSDYPAVPAKSGYTGEWVKYTSAIHSNVTVQAKYTAVVTKYTVFFKADGFTVKAIQVNDGYVLQDADYPEVPAKVGCNGAWEKHTAAIHSNVTINAVYSPIASHYTVTFKANGKTLKTMTVADGYVLKTSDYPTIPKRAGYTGSWPKTGAIHANTTITAVYTKDSGIVIPTQPTSPGEIMSGGAGEPVENEPVEADAPAEDETVSPQGMHVTGTQTVTHEYLTLNGKVARETIKTNNSLTAVLDFVYDESGKPFALKYSTNGTSFQTYYYVLNLQGDVVKLIHYIPGFEYESVATYEYDAWGNIVSSSGRLAEINPLRYRGYYYDNETGFYYLQSRYYDPANRRFINADCYTSTNNSNEIACNMFTYCYNNPITYHDSCGTEPVETIDIYGNGSAYCYVYEYSYSGNMSGILGTSSNVQVSESGKLYIYKGVTQDYFEDSSNTPEGFRAGVDFMVGDFIESSKNNPNLQVRDSYRCTMKSQMKAITSILLEYAEGTEWKRTQDSLITEWREHNRYAWASARAKHVDFDNKEEGKGFFYFLGKAMRSIWEN